MKKIKRSKRPKKSKKAVVEVQFNWIFVLVAGALILLFFIVIINKQRAVSNKKLAIDILNSMDKIIAGQKTSENRQDFINMYETEMSYLCGGCDCTFSLAGMSKSKGNIVVFAPASVKSNTLLTWTQSWDMPFRVTNFVYMSVPEAKYYFISPSNSIKRDFIDNLPVNLTYEVVGGVEDIKYKGEQKIRLVFFPDTMSPPMPDGLKEVSDPIITALVISGSSQNWYNGYGKLSFYKKKGNAFVDDFDEEGAASSYKVLGMQTAYGAVYSDNFQSFRCNMDDAVKRLKLVADIYKERADQLSMDAVDGRISQGCGAFYATAYFNGFNVAPENIAQKTSALYDSINLLVTFNEGAIINSCPRVY